MILGDELPDPYDEREDDDDRDAPLDHAGRSAGRRRGSSVTFKGCGARDFRY